MRWVGAFAACLLAAWMPGAKATSTGDDAQQALAPDANVSYSLWTVSGREVILRFLVPVPESERMLGRLPPVLRTQRLGEYILEHTAVAASGQDCPAEDQGYDIGRVDPLSVGPGLSGFEIFFRCPTGKGLVLEDSALFDRPSGHVNFARIEIRGRFHQTLFTSAKRDLSLAYSGAPAAAGLASYAPLGARHVLQRADLICFLLGAALLFAEQSKLGGLAAGLGAGYLSSVVFASSDWIASRDAMPGAFPGLLVALLAALYVARAPRAGTRTACIALAALLLTACAAVILHRPDAALLLAGGALFCGSALAVEMGTAPRSALLALAAFLLAMVDGFTLPQVLVPLELPASATLPILAGFDLGALGAELVLLCVTIAAYRLLVDGMTKSGGGAGVPLMRDLAAAAVGGLGVFWLVSRSLSG